MPLFKLGRGPTSYNYYLLRGVMDEKAISEARAATAALPAMGGIYSKTAENKMYTHLDLTPTLVETLNLLFDDFHIIGSNFFCSEPTEPGKAAHGEWHSGHSLYFGVKGAAMTLWIPLQDLNDETGGRLKIYNGEYISQMDDLLNVQVETRGNSISNAHSILSFLNAELEEHAKAESMNVGDALLFDEMLPHQAEKCLIKRDVLAIRLVFGEYDLDRPLIESVIRRYETAPGEANHAQEFLENLLEFREYELPGTGSRAAAGAPEEAPLRVVEQPNQSLFQRVRGRLRVGSRVRHG
jgi:hypothetical protein